MPRVWRGQSDEFEGYQKRLERKVEYTAFATERGVGEHRLYA